MSREQVEAGGHTDTAIYPLSVRHINHHHHVSDRRGRSGILACFMLAGVLGR